MPTRGPDATSADVDKAVELTDIDRVADDSFISEQPNLDEENRPPLLLRLHRAFAEIKRGEVPSDSLAPVLRESFDPVLRALVSRNQPWLYLGVALFVMWAMLQIFAPSAAVPIPYRGATDFQARLNEISNQLKREHRGMTAAESKEIASRFAIEANKYQTAGKRRSEAIEKCTSKGLSREMCASAAERAARRADGVEPSAWDDIGSVRERMFAPGTAEAEAADIAVINGALQGGGYDRHEAAGMATGAVLGAETPLPPRDFQERLDEISKQLTAEGRGMTKSEAAEIAQRFAIEVTKQQYIAGATPSAGGTYQQPEVRPTEDKWYSDKGASKDAFYGHMMRALDALKSKHQT